MTARLATDAEVATWREEGWVLLEGLVGVCALGLVVELARRVAIVTRMKRSRVTRLPRFRNLVAARRLRR